MIKFLFLLSLLVSCGSDDLKVYSKLEGLRILAISADSPEINTAQTITLIPYFSYTDGGDTTLEISYEACLDPGIAYGSEISCSGYNSSEIISGSTTFDTSTIGSDNYYTGEMTPITIDIPATAFVYLNTLESSIQFNGIDMIVIFNFKDQNVPQNNIETIKRISLTTKESDLNTNPIITGLIQSQGSNLAAFPSGTTNLSVDGLSTAESYQLDSYTGRTTLDEIMTVTWFSNKGDFLYDRTEPEDPVEFDPSGNTEGIFVAVYRDNRGGVTVIKKIVPE